MSQSVEVVAEFAGEKITETGVISRLKLTGAWFAAINDLVREAVVSGAAREAGLTVSEAQLQQAVDSYRRSRRLEKAADTRRWLEAAGITVEDLENFIEAGLLQMQLAEKLIDNARVASYYNQHPREFEYARVSHIVVAERGVAEELALSLREEGEDFAALAREHSIDESTRSGGGFIGLVTRNDADRLPPNVADQVFAGTSHEVIGPFENGGGYCLIRVEEVGRRPLDNSVRIGIRQRLFEQWLAQKLTGK